MLEQCPFLVKICTGLFKCLAAVGFNDVRRKGFVVVMWILGEVVSNARVFVWPFAWTKSNNSCCEVAFVAPQRKSHASIWSQDVDEVVGVAIHAEVHLVVWDVRQRVNRLVNLPVSFLTDFAAIAAHQRVRYTKTCRCTWPCDMDSAEDYRGVGTQPRCTLLATRPSQLQENRQPIKCISNCHGFESRNELYISPLVLR